MHAAVRNLAGTRWYMKIPRHFFAVFAASTHCTQLTISYVTLIVACLITLAEMRLLQLVSLLCKASLLVEVVHSLPVLSNLSAFSK